MSRNFDWLKDTLQDVVRMQKFLVETEKVSLTKLGVDRATEQKLYDILQERVRSDKRSTFVRKTTVIQPKPNPNPNPNPNPIPNPNVIVHDVDADADAKSINLRDLNQFINQIEDNEEKVEAREVNFGDKNLPY